MTRRARRSRALVPIGAALAIAVVACVASTGTASATAPRVPPVLYRISAGLTASQTVPAVQAPTAARAEFDALLVSSGLRVRSGLPGRFAGPGCHGVVHPGTKPAPMVCKKKVGVPPTPSVQWRLGWRLFFTGLSSAATHAAIHLGQPGVAGPAAIQLCAPCQGVSGGTTAVTADQALALSNGGAYVEIQTVQNPGGEVRGQIRRLGALGLRG